MTGDLSRAKLQVGRLRAFASVTTRGHPGADAVILDLLAQRPGSTAGGAVGLYRELYLRLRRLAPCRRPPARPAPGASEVWSDFHRLRDVQRSAVFLVLGADFSIRDAAAVLGEPEAWLTMEVIAAMFSLEHILPAQREECGLLAAARPRRGVRRGPAPARRPQARPAPSAAPTIL